MDREWMLANRLSLEYQNGIREFIKFAVDNAKNPEKIPCPCTKCYNSKRIGASSLRDHLIMNGIDPVYTCWIWHGEKEQRSVSMDAPLETNNLGGDHFEEMAQVVEEDFIHQPDIFDNLLRDAREPLNSSCTKLTRLSTVLRLYNLKAALGWTDKSFTALLQLLKEMLLEDIVLPDSTYRAKQEVEGLKGQVTDLQSQVDFLQKMIMDMQGRDSEVEHNHNSRHDSCSLKDLRSDAEPNKGEWTKCELYWSDLTIMVAKGRVFIPESGSYTILHGKDLDLDTLKVTLDTVVLGQENADIPYSTDEVSCIEDAIGGFIAWPKDMSFMHRLHWMLVVIDLLQNIIYWLDPLGYDARTDFIEVATMAMKKFNAKLCKENKENGKKNTKKKKQEIQWKSVKCPKQPNDY